MCYNPLKIIKAYLLLHLYYKSTTSSQILDVVKAFEFCDAIDVSSMSEVKDADVYLVEIHKIEKNLLLHIRKLLSKKTDSLIYFFIDDSNSLILFQLASLLNVKSIITPKQDTLKAISKIKSDIYLKNSTAQNKEIADTLSDNISFMTFNQNSLTFASKKLLSTFKCRDLYMLEANLCSKIDLKSFLESDTTKEENIALEEVSKTYSINSISSKLSSQKYIFVQELMKKEHQKESSVDFIKNRIYFIEVLKEKLLEKNFSSNIYSIITISIENMTTLSKFWSEYEIEMALRDLLLQVELNIDAHTLLAQYNNNFYITLFEGLDFEATKQKAEAIQKHIATYSSKEKIKPIIGLHVFDVNSYELNDALKIISDIANESISTKDIEAQKIYRIIDLGSTLCEEKAIDLLLQAAFTNKTPLKLLNIYKGLCINTSSLIVKKTPEEIYVSFEQLQGTVMNFEKKSVIQSACFAKDIEADVKLIDLKKRVALLRNFKFANGSANARKYSRVASSQRIPVSVVSSKGSLNGEILDISMNSIALKTRLFKQIEELNSKDVELRFTLPIKSSQEGYMKLSLDAKVAFTKCSEEFCKIVVDLEEDQAHESILMEYVYNRQKEIIVELKKQTIMRS